MSERGARRVTIFFSFCFKWLFPGSVWPEMRLRRAAPHSRICPITFIRNCDSSSDTLGRLVARRKRRPPNGPLNRMFLFMSLKLPFCLVSDSQLIYCLSNKFSENGRRNSRNYPILIRIVIETEPFLKSQKHIIKKILSRYLHYVLHSHSFGLIVTNLFHLNLHAVGL